jgi:hypothetical protein
LRGTGTKQDDCGVENKPLAFCIEWSQSLNNRIQCIEFSLTVIHFIANAHIVTFRKKWPSQEREQSQSGQGTQGSAFLGGLTAAHSQARMSQR